MRLFVAIALPDRQRARLESLANGLPGARWLPPENLHLSLRFLGELDGALAADVDEALSVLRMPAFQLALKGVSHFGEGRKIRTLWAGVEPEPALVRLRVKVEQAVIRAGVTRVVVAMIDPFAKVAGEGVEKLRAAGVEGEVASCCDEPEFVH